MAQEVKYLSYSGLSHFKDKLDEAYAAKIHSHTVANITDFGTHVYYATATRAKNTVLAAPNGSNGVASFRALVAADLPTHTHSYLPLSGGALTGPLVFNGSDTDRNIIRVNNTTGDATKTGSYGYTLKYLGSGSGDNNSLALFSDNVTATTQNKAIEIKQSGNIHARNIIPLDNNTYNLGSSSLKWKNVYATTFTGNLTGNADTATKASTVVIAANSDNVACELWFQDSTRDGSRGKLTYDNDLRYNPSKNMLMIGGMTSTTASPTSANIVLDGTNKKLSLGESYIQYNSLTGCLEIIA